MSNNTRNVVCYSVGFTGIFGKNRKPKYTSSPDSVFPEATVLSDEELIKLCEAYVEKIGAKTGKVRATRYDNCTESTYSDIPGNGLVIPITQGEKVWEYSI